MATINWGERAATAKNDFEPLPIDTYDARVENAEYKLTKTAGDPMFVVTFVIEGGPHDGRKVWRNIVLTAKSEGMFFDNMRTMGLTNEFFASVPAGEESRICGALIDARVQVKVKHREYQGKTQNDVDKILPANAVAAGPTFDAPAAPAQDAGKPVRPF